MSQALCFNDVRLDIVPNNFPNNSEPWVRSPQIGEALGYAKGSVSIAKLYDAHADEFTPGMTAVVTLPTQGGPQETRIFSLRGCHLLAMFARTPVAKEFRKWVLDVLDKLAEQEQGNANEGKQALSTPASRIPLRKLVHTWSVVSGQPHSILWPQVKGYFQLSSIAALPESLLPEALAFVQERIDACQKALPAATAPELPVAKTKSIYRDGCFYLPGPNPNHVEGPREKALIDYWRYESKFLEGLEQTFNAFLDNLDAASGDICRQAVAVIGKDTDTMFSPECILSGLTASRNMAQESFKTALSLARQHRKMSLNLAAAMGK